MAKKFKIKGIVRVPSDIVTQVLDDNSTKAEFKKAQRSPQFHSKENICYIVQASLRYDGHDYFVAQELGSSDLVIGYTAKDDEDAKPDITTQRKIRKIISEKYFWDKTNRNPSYTRIFWFNNNLELSFLALLAFNLNLCKMNFCKVNFCFM